VLHLLGEVLGLERLRAGADALALLLEVLGQGADPLAHLLVRVALHQPTHEVWYVAVVKRQFGAVLVWGDVEVGDSRGNRQLEGLIQIDCQALVGFIPINALVDAAERSEVTMSSGSFAHWTLRGQVRACHSIAPSLDVSEVSQHFPDGLHWGIDVAGDRELWHFGLFAVHASNTTKAAPIPDNSRIGGRPTRDEVRSSAR